MSEYIESKVEKAFYDCFCASTSIRAFGVEVRRFSDQHDPAGLSAIVLRCFQTQNLNTGCKGGGTYYSALLQCMVVGDYPTDKAKTVQQMISGACEELIATLPGNAEALNTLLTGVVVDGIIYDASSESLQQGTVVGNTLPSLRVFFHTT